jgi:hypothetical protein
MGIENLIEEAAGAFVADQALEKVDPNAGILAKGAAAIAGFEGVSKVQDMLGSDEQQAAAPTDETPQQD